MLNRWNRAVTGLVIVTTSVMAIGGGSAWGAGLKLRAGRIGGIVRPIGAGNAIQHQNGSLSYAQPLGVQDLGPGSPSPLCSPGPPQAPACVPPLLYNGGPVMHAVTTHVIAWDPAAAFPSGYVSGYEQYLLDVSHDLGLGTNVTSVANEYVDASGPALSSLTNDTAIIDTHPYPNSGCTVSGASACLTEQQLLTEVGHEITSGGLSMNLDQSYIVLLPPTVDTCIDSTSTTCEAQSFCGYHDAFTDGSADATFALLPYTDSSYSNSGGHACIDPSVTYPGSDPALMALDSIGAHELIESATDPLVGSGYLDANGWEIGDECAWDYGTTTAATGGGVYNQLIHGDQYLTQTMWSNQDNSCSQGDPVPAAAATITSGATPMTNSPTSFSASLSHDTSTASSYEWSYMDPNQNLDQNVSTSATPELMLSTAGTYTVWVQITDSSSGTVIGVTDVTVTAAPTAAFNDTYSTAVPATGSPVNFASSSTAYSGESITSSSWDFGDGTSGSGSAVSHTYSAPGQYTVTLTVSETNGATAQVSHTITVDAVPTAAFTSSPASAVAGTGVQFTSGAAAGAGTLTYLWDFGDGSTSTAENPAHTYASAGTYTVTFTVKQSDGLTASVQHTVTVAAPPPTGSNARATATTWLGHVLRATRGSGRITTLLKRDGTRAVVSAPSFSGHVTITWYATVKHHRTVVARGSATVTAKVRPHIVIRLTRAGRSLLRRSRRVKVSMAGVYRFGSSRVTATRTAETSLP